MVSHATGARVATARRERTAERRGQTRLTDAELGAIITANLSVITIRARQLCGSHGGAQDLVHDAVLRAYQRRHQLRDRASARAWLLAIVRTIFLDGLRRQRRQEMLFLAGDPADAVHEPVHREPWDHITEDDLQAAIASLSDDVRTTYLIFAEGCRYAEIAARLNIPRATVGTRIHRARRQLHALLAPKSDGNDPA
jgi:RNA polymerase sigma-70 factor (ECF subfamily)